MSKRNKNKNKNQPSTPQRHAPISIDDMNSIFTPIKASVESAPAISSVDEASPEINAPKESLLNKIKNLIPSENKLSDEEKETLKALQNELNDVIGLYKIAKEDCDKAKNGYETQIKELGKTAKKQEDKESTLNDREDGLNKRENKLNEREGEAKKREDKVTDREGNAQAKEEANKKEAERLEGLNAQIKQREAEADAGFIANETRWKNEITEKLNKDLESTRNSLQSKFKEYENKLATLSREQEQSGRIILQSERKSSCTGN